MRNFFCQEIVTQQLVNENLVGGATVAFLCIIFVKKNPNILCNIRLPPKLYRSRRINGN